MQARVPSKQRKACCVDFGHTQTLGDPMETIILREYAAQADRLIAERRRQVAHQHEIVTDLECAGRDSQEARRLLREFEACLILQVADRNRLHEHLAL